MDKIEVLIERPFGDPTERLAAMQTYEDMVNFLRAEKAKWVLAYCDVLANQLGSTLLYPPSACIAWKFQIIQDEDIRRRFNLIFDSP